MSVRQQPKRPIARRDRVESLRGARRPPATPAPEDVCTLAFGLHLDRSLAIM
jgi:hypothetical protein